MDSLNRFPRMVQEYFVDRVRSIERQSLQTQAALVTKADAEAYVESVRRRIRESFGPMPEKTPLKPRVMGVVERDAYRIENVIFESRPEFLVTANLYIPKNRKTPMPGVDETSGPSWTTPAYDAAGNMTTVPQPADPTATFTATYDAWNRLVKLVDTSSSDTVAEYAYDGSKRGRDCVLLA